MILKTEFNEVNYWKQLSFMKILEFIATCFPLR